MQTEVLWHKMYRENIYAGRRGIAIHAMSGIDMALWDIKGKVLGLPIWKLLGGGFHHRIRAYASSLFGATPRETGERARRFRDKGFDAVKFGWAPMGRGCGHGCGPGAGGAGGAGGRRRPADRRRAGLGRQDRYSTSQGPSASSISSGWRNPCCRTTTGGTPDWLRRPTFPSPPARRKASAAHLSS